MSTQAQIDAKQQEVTNLQGAVSSSRSYAQSALQSINDCKDKCNSPTVGAGVKFSISTNPDEMFAEDLSDYSGCCGSGSANNFPGCADASTCASRFSDATTKLNNYHNNVSALEKAQDELETLKEELEIPGQNGDYPTDGNGNGVTPYKGSSWWAKNKTWVIWSGVAVLAIVMGLIIYNLRKKK